MAVTVAEPAETADSTPEAETVAMLEGDVLQVALEVTSLVVESLKVQIAVSWMLSPATNPFPGVDI